MKKPSSKIREEIAHLQEQLRAAETREAERIGRIALRAGIGEIAIEEGNLQAAFEEIAARFRGQGGKATGKRDGDPVRRGNAPTTKVEPGPDPDGAGEA